MPPAKAVPPNEPEAFTVSDAPDMQTVRVDAAQGRLRLTMTAQQVGTDFNVCLFGGDVPHIGAVALAHAHECLHQPGQRSATCSLLCLTGHKEDELARRTALTLARALNTTVCVCCGIHMRDITPEEIRLTLELSQALTTRLAARLASRLATPLHPTA